MSSLFPPLDASNLATNFHRMMRQENALFQENSSTIGQTSRSGKLGNFKSECCADSRKYDRERKLDFGMCHFQMKKRPRFQRQQRNCLFEGFHFQAGLFRFGDLGTRKKNVSVEIYISRSEEQSSEEGNTNVAIYEYILVSIP